MICIYPKHFISLNIISNKSVLRQIERWLLKRSVAKLFSLENNHRTFETSIESLMQ